LIDPLKQIKIHFIQIPGLHIHFAEGAAATPQYRASFHLPNSLRTTFPSLSSITTPCIS